MGRQAEVPWLVIDSTVLGAHDRYLESTPARALLDESRARRLRLAVPEVVVLESVGNHAKAVHTAEEQLRSASEALDRLRVPGGRDRPPRKLTYREDLEQILHEASAEILPIPATPHRRLVEKASRRRPPFDAKGNGYRDALVWESVLELLGRAREPVVLISSDRAFSRSKDTAEIAPRLMQELRERGYQARVDLCFQLSDFTRRFARIQELTRTWWHSIAENADLREALEALLLRTACADADDVLLNRASPAVRNARFSGLENPRDLRIIDVWASEEGDTTQLDVALTLDYEIDCELPFRADADQPVVWSSATAGSENEFTFEVLQRGRTKPFDLAARLTGWSGSPWPIYT